MPLIRRKLSGGARKTDYASGNGQAFCDMIPMSKPYAPATTSFSGTARKVVVRIIAAGLSEPAGLGIPQIMKSRAPLVGFSQHAPVSTGASGLAEGLACRSTISVPFRSAVPQSGRRFRRKPDATPRSAFISCSQHRTCDAEHILNTIIVRARSAFSQE